DECENARRAYGRPIYEGCRELPDAPRDIPPRRVGPDAPGKHRPTGRRAAVQHGTARCAGGLYRGLPRRAADPAPDSLDVPARSCGSGALGGGPGPQVTDRRRLGKGAGCGAVESECKVPGAVPGRTCTLDQHSALVAEPRYAFATQQADMFAAVQRLRRLAQANNKL